MTSAAGAAVPLLPDEAHLWLAATDGEALAGLPAAWELLDSAERARADRFLVERPRVEYILSHGLVRRALAAHTGADPRDFAFREASHGKPFLLAPAEHAGVRFNLSHTRGVSVCAVTLGREVGVDVEKKRADLTLENLAGTVFSRAGMAAFAALPAERRRDYFFAKWTLKEALVKARGDGLSLDVQRITARLRPDGSLERMTLDGVDVSSTWHIAQLQPSPEHAGAVVIAASGSAAPQIVEHR